MRPCNKCGGTERYANGKCASCARKRARSGSYRRRIEVLLALGPKCVDCGYIDIRALEIDHIYNNGAEHRKAGRGTTYYKSMLDNLDEYQVLCSNCNQIKRHEHKKISGS